MAQILPDDIRTIQDKQDVEKIQVIYDYIKYMREYLDFWGNNRSKEISSIEAEISELRSRSLHFTRTNDGMLQITME